MTYIQAALIVLAHADRPLTVGEITAVAVAHGLVRPRGRTPDRTMASVLYRRMAADPDAPIISRVGRFWLRGRPLPAAEATYLGQRARRSRVAARRPRQAAHAQAARRAATLPPPPLSLPDEALRALATASRFRTAEYAPTRRERAVARAGERGEALLARLAARRADTAGWDVTRTDKRLVGPLLVHLGYRGAAVERVEHAGRGVLGYLLHAGSVPAIALDVRRLAHDLDDDDAWRALGRAHLAGARFAAVTNGRELRLYSVTAAEARDDPAAALAVMLHLAPAECEDERAVQAAALWLLSRQVVAAGALDAYVTDRAVGAALLGALDEPASPLARALVSAVRAQLGVELPPTLVLRHARLALREARGRDGEPLPRDVAAVAAIAGPRLDSPVAALSQSA